MDSGLGSCRARTQLCLTLSHRPVPANDIGMCELKWLNDIILNIDGIALCKVLVLNQTEQGLRHLLGCAIILSLCLRACLRLGRSATFDLSPKESEASL